MPQANKHKGKNSLNKMFIPVIFITTKTGDKSNTPKLRKQWWTDRTDTHSHHKRQAGKWFTFQTRYTQNSTAIRYLGTRAVHFHPCPQCLVWGTHLNISQVTTCPSQLSEWVTSTGGDVWKKTKARVWVLEMTRCMPYKRKEKQYSSSK